MNQIDIVYNIGNLDECAWKRFENSYKFLLKCKDDFKIVVSENGEKNSEERIKQFINNFKYHFQEGSMFNASITKNNAYKYLITNELFVFLDIDMLVPKDFISKIGSYYNKIQTPFVTAWRRLPKEIINITNYDELYKLSNELTIGRGWGNSGDLVCDKKTYKLLNGFDEEYIGWGARDSDFNIRALLLDKMGEYNEVILLHQYHENNKKYVSTCDDNRIRFNKRWEEVKKDKNTISQIKGLEDLRINKEK